MKQLQTVAFIGNHLPRRCGIATFTHDLHQAVIAARPELKTTVVAMTDPGREYDYPKDVGFQIRDDVVTDYIAAAKYLNSSGYQLACLQHEYGIFGGEAGGNIVELLSRLKMSIVTTLHTVLRQPTPVQKGVMQQIIDASSKIVVMSDRAREFLCSVHTIQAGKIEVIAHGIPDFPFLESHPAKTKFGFADKTVILTFGLLSPNKGIETMLEAMPGIIKSCPNAVYVVLGATHPNLVRDHGEAYRESLVARAERLGITDHVVFFNQFVDQATLLDFISMCDVYVTPYLNESQMTSGTLAYSFGLGKAIVSTPYWHATDLLGSGNGILVPFGDEKIMGAEISNLLTDAPRQLRMRQQAYAESRSMTWPQTAKRYLASFEMASKHASSAIMIPARKVSALRQRLAVPEMKIEHFLSMCDSTGMLQHAVHSVQDRAHGYCIDDNARALLFSSKLADSSEIQLSERTTANFAAFIQHAWNPDIRRFRNFMSYDRRWLEPAGSEDSHGRTLWALGECALKDIDPSRRRWAASLFRISLPVVEEFTSPRAWAFTLLGLEAYGRLTSDDTSANRLRRLLADRLIAMLPAGAPNEWFWFENVLAYDNARLSEALIKTGLATGNQNYVEAGITTLRWLTALQTTSSGAFRPIGTRSFGRWRQKPEPFDQQPVEAAATISACLTARRAEGGAGWLDSAMAAFGWFVGENDLQVSLIDPITGSCADGLHPDRANENKGAESVLSFLLGLLEIREYERSELMRHKQPASKLECRSAVHSIAPKSTSGGHVVSVPILEPPDIAPSARSRPSRRPPIQAGD